MVVYDPTFAPYRTFISIKHAKCLVSKTQDVYKYPLIEPQYITKDLNTVFKLMNEKEKEVNSP
jgi:hypothetical protein